MPYKNKEDRLAAYRRWYHRHKGEHAKRKRVEWIAKRDNPIRKRCSIKGCNVLGERHHPDYTRPSKIIWLCKKHHEQVHSTRYCTVGICFNKHYAKGFCVKHYSQDRRDRAKIPTPHQTPKLKGVATEAQKGPLR